MKKSFLQIVLKRQVFITIILIIAFLFFSNLFIDTAFETAIVEPIAKTFADNTVSFRENWSNSLINLQYSYHLRLDQAFNCITEYLDQNDLLTEAIINDILNNVRLKENLSEFTINWRIEALIDFDNESKNKLLQEDSVSIIIDELFNNTNTGEPKILAYYKLPDEQILEMELISNDDFSLEFNKNIAELINHSKYIKTIDFYSSDYTPLFESTNLNTLDQNLFKSLGDNSEPILKNSGDNIYTIYISTQNHVIPSLFSSPILRTKIILDFSKLHNLKNRYVTFFNIFIIAIFLLNLLINFGFSKKLVLNLKRIINRLYEFENNPKSGLGDLDKHNDFRETEELGNAFKIMAHKIKNMFEDQIRINKKLEITKDKLELLASQDELTGVENRRSFYKRIQYLIDNDIFPWSIVFIDMDNLKTINDRFGHNIGDKALYLIGKTLEAFTRSTDYVSRIGGDEFAVAFVNISEEKSKIIMNRINSVLLQKGKELHDDLNISISYGICSVHCKEESDIETIIKIADNRMYEFKNKKKQR